MSVTVRMETVTTSKEETKRSDTNRWCPVAQPTLPNSIRRKKTAVVCNFAQPYPVFLGHSKNLRSSNTNGVSQTMQTARKVKAVRSAQTNPVLDSLLKDVVARKDLLKL